MIVIKRDFVNIDTPSYCNGKPLSSGKAFFLRNSNGQIFFGGRVCAARESSTDLSAVPDFTSGLISLDDASNPNGGSGGNSTSNYVNTQYKRAVTYLLLREDRLYKFKYNGQSLSYSVLKNFFVKYQDTGTLSGQEIKHINNIEKVSRMKTGNKMSLKNLLACCAYEYILEQILLTNSPKNAGVAFINDINNFLHRECILTTKQVEAVKKWLPSLWGDLQKCKLVDFDW